MKKIYKRNVWHYVSLTNCLKHCLIITLFLFVAHAQAQGVIIKGTVRDEQGVTLPGASVLLSGTDKGTVTNTNGVFSINVPGDAAILVFTYLGFDEQRIKVGLDRNLNVTLKSSANALNEVVVVGYGTQKKSDVTGAITSLDTKDLETMPQTNVQQALQGKIAGLSAQTIGASAEGGNLNLQVRGVNSIGASNNPLVVVDGVIFSNSLSEINPEDIASLQVLKDASSSAIYGARAANGVILITTKKGKTGIAKISYNDYFGTDKAVNIPDMMSGERFYQLKAQRFGAGSITNTEQNSIDNGISTNWIDLALRDGFRQQHNLGVSGGSDDTHYYFSGTMNKNAGISKNDNFDRYSLRLNVDSKIGKIFTIGTNTQFGLYDRGGTPANFTQAFVMNPLTIPYNADGSINLTPWPDDAFWYNPLQGLNVLNNDLTRSVFSNNYINVDIPFVKGLSYRLNTGYNYTNQGTETYYGQNTRTGLQNKGQADISNNNTVDWLVENLLNYNRTFGKHSIGFTGLYSVQQRKYTSHGTTGVGFTSDIQTFYQNATASLITAKDDFSQTNNISQMGRLNYSYDGKYLLTATVRRDGFSGFGSNRKFGTFPSLGLGWNISKEEFLNQYNWIDNLKLRLSFGKNGNQAIDPYATLPQLSTQNYLNNDGSPAIGYYTNKLGDPSLGWETTVSWNFGLDYSFIKGRIYGSVDYYSSKTSDLLLARAISPVNGVKNITQNIGETKNHGLDFLISSMNVRKGDFSWSTDLNFSLYRNKIVNVGLTNENGNYIDDIGNRWFIGQPINVTYAYVFDGIYQANDDIANSVQPTAKPGDVKVKDVNGDGQITADDKAVIGNSVPDYSAGLTNTFNYKNFSLSFFIRNVQGITKTNTLLNTYFDGRNGALDRQFWTPENPINTYPENRDDANPFGVGIFEKKQSDASFIRLQDVSLSYTLPTKLISKWKVDRLQIFVNAKNLATRTNWVGLDPEFSNQTAQPQVKSFVIGLRTQF
ncbi:TonB-dependent receptor [Arcticibacter svalbardensis MN12-7]|uniref:TonB-dependent receptor n=1 Tax=Arcticibacter svalbardensis MN12-7 TaxID=1150600 RepID=R9H217_9SPHI|nr:TonB-dependent receptor [Arcticibacter svalbardensis]EOR95239.1 TonB-dependent receptor [Arcticibacter svalbardensis MN12-7]